MAFAKEDLATPSLYSLLDTERKFNEERSKFEEERCELLKQIQSADDNKGSPDISQAELLSPPTYSQVVKWTSVKPARKQAEKQAPKAPISTSNRFLTLKDETETDMDDKISSPPSPPAQAIQKNKNSKPKKDETKTEMDDKISSPPSPPVQAIQKNNNSKPKSHRRPKVFILGDSISKRIDGQKLSRGSDIVNKSVGGRTIQRVCDDIRTTDFSDADSAIFHVGTNNLQKDSTSVANDNLYKMSNLIVSSVPNSCKVALSSIIKRTDKPELAQKVSSLNHTLENLCTQNNWTYINNDSVVDLADGLHPNDRGMSFLATNFQGFLKVAHPFLFQQSRKQTYSRRHSQHMRNSNPTSRMQAPLLGNMPMWLTYLMNNQQIKL